MVGLPDCEKKFEDMCSRLHIVEQHCELKEKSEQVQQANVF